MTAIVCSDPKHGERSALSGWAATLGTTDRPESPAGYLCEACVRQRKAEAVVDRAHGTCEVTFTLSGRVTASVVTRYDDGTIIERRSKSLDAVNELTLIERTHLQQILQKLLGRV
jgi:hypothetical protein